MLRGLSPALCRLAGKSSAWRRHILRVGDASAGCRAGCAATRPPTRAPAATRQFRAMTEQQAAKRAKLDPAPVPHVVEVQAAVVDAGLLADEAAATAASPPAAAVVPSQATTVPPAGRKQKNVVMPILVPPPQMPTDQSAWDNAVLLVDKPKGWTSFDVCGKLRGALAALLRKKHRDLKGGPVLVQQRLAPYCSPANALASRPRPRPRSCPPVLLPSPLSWPCRHAGPHGHWPPDRLRGQGHKGRGQVARHLLPPPPSPPACLWPQAPKRLPPARLPRLPWPFRPPACLQPP